MGVYPFSEARHLLLDVLYAPLSAPHHPIPRPPVLGRAIVGVADLRRCARVGPRTLWDRFELSEVRWYVVEVTPIDWLLSKETPGMLTPKMCVGLRMSFVTAETKASTGSVLPAVICA